MAHRQSQRRGTVPTQGDSDTQTQDSRRSIVDVLEFDLTRGDSDEELIPVDSPGSEVEFEESIAGEEEAAPVSEEEFTDVLDIRAAVLRAAFRTLDDVDPCHQFRQRAAVMKRVPRIFQGLFRNALKVALKEIIEGAGEVEQERGWKLLLMLPRMLLHRPPGGSKVSKSKLRAGFESFSRGDWIDLIVASERSDERAAISRSRSNRRAHDDLESRAARAEMLVSLGELSSARQALEGAALAPRIQATLDGLKDADRRPPRAREPLPDRVTSHVPPRVFHLEQHFCRNLTSARRGAPAGPSGMTTEHLRPLLNDAHTTNLFFRVGEKLSRGDVPQSVVQMVRQGRMTALAKPDGGVRGIVAGDVIRRLVAKTMAQQLGDAVEAFTAPYQYVLRTKAGCECVAHVLQGLTELDPLATVTSVDGISAFDLISRKAMLEGLMRVDGGSSALPFVRLFHGSPSEYLWEDATGMVHTIPQGEGGEQGDHLMPLLFSVGQHSSLEAVGAQLRRGEHLLAFLDDIHMVTPREGRRSARLPWR